MFKNINKIKLHEKIIIIKIIIIKMQFKILIIKFKDVFTLLKTLSQSAFECGKLSMSRANVANSWNSNFPTAFL